MREFRAAHFQGQFLVPRKIFEKFKHRFEDHYLGMQRLELRP
jgi:hypothetical protein